jgi:sulfofructose kinase
MTHVITQRVPVVICVGQAVMDHRFSVAETPSRAQKYLASHYQALPGGMATGAAITAARLGARAYLVSRVGDDAAATSLLSILEQEHIDTHFTERVSGCRTAVSAITIDPNGERQVVHATTDAFDRGRPINTAELPVADAVLVDPRWPKASLAALTWARQHGIPSVLDADIAPPDVLRELLPHVDWAVFSSHGLSHLFPTASQVQKLRQATALGPRVVAVTCGEDGVQWLTQDNRVEHLAAIDNPVTDTTGAGDVFHGALAFALATLQYANRFAGTASSSASTTALRSTANTKSLLAFANQIAAYKVAAGNGILGAPRASDVTQALQNLRTECALPAIS